MNCAGFKQITTVFKKTITSLRGVMNDQVLFIQEGKDNPGCKPNNIQWAEAGEFPGVCEASLGH